MVNAKAMDARILEIFRQRKMVVAMVVVGVAILGIAGTGVFGLDTKRQKQS